LTSILCLMMILLCGCRDNQDHNEVRINLNTIRKTKDLQIETFAKSFEIITIPGESDLDKVRKVCREGHITVVLFWLFETNGVLIRNANDSSDKWIKSSSFHLDCKECQIIDAQIDSKQNKIYFVFSGYHYIGIYDISNETFSNVYVDNGIPLLLHPYVMADDSLILWKPSNSFNDGNIHQFFLGKMKSSVLQEKLITNFPVPTSSFDSISNSFTINYPKTNSSTTSNGNEIGTRSFFKQEFLDTYGEFSLTCLYYPVNRGYCNALIAKQEYLILKLVNNGEVKYIYYDKIAKDGFYIRKITSSHNPSIKMDFETYINVYNNAEISFVYINPDTSVNQKELLIISL